MGLKVLGRYRILGELGRGAMGVVYRAVDPVIEREVALKTLHAELPADVAEEVRVRFLREARSAGRLSHPNIVTIFDVGEDGGAAYIAMELLEGPSLQQMLKERQRIPFHSAADIIAQVADALHHAHQFSIVHRDVKPANVVVSRSGRAKLTDFGVAYVPSSEVTQHGSALGSPRYMAPEQVLGQPIDARADVFSLGVMVFEMLAGHRPIGGDEPTEIALAYLTGRIPHVRDLAPTIPPEIDAVIFKAMAPKPADRLQSVRAMREVLEPFLLATRPPQMSRLPSADQSGARPVPGTNIYDDPSFDPNFPERTKKSVPYPHDVQDSRFSVPVVTPPAAPVSMTPGGYPAAPQPGYPMAPQPQSGPMSPSGYPQAPPPVSIQQFPYGPSVLPPPPPRPKGNGPALVAGIAIAILLVLGGGALWAVYYFTDVFDDPPAKKKPKPAPRPAPRPTPHPPAKKSPTQLR